MAGPGCGGSGGAALTNDVVSSKSKPIIKVKRSIFMLIPPFGMNNYADNVGRETDF
jgi:hypothetical protein